MEEARLPEEIVVHILTYLPVKSLIRFTCVSRTFHSIILSDSKFARSQFLHCKSPPRALLYSRITETTPRFESINPYTLSFGDRRELKPPFLSPSPDVWFLGSCNGFVLFAYFDYTFHLWNPLNGYFKLLPHPGLSRQKFHLVAFGVGYLSATDDYRVFAVFSHFPGYIREKKAMMFSTRAQAWKGIEFVSNEVAFVSNYRCGALLKEALHWVRWGGEILAFDLGQEGDKYKLRRMLLPDDEDRDDNNENFLGVSAAGCLCLARLLADGSADLWVMGEYGVRESWTKLFKLKLFDLPDDIEWVSNDVLVLEKGLVAQIGVQKKDEEEYYLVKMVLKEEEDKLSISEIESNFILMIHYQESLLRIDD